MPTKTSAPLPTAVILVVAMLAALVGCGSTTSEPPSVAGVMAMYRAIDANASKGNFADICQHYFDARFQAEVKAFRRDCPTILSERWAERVRASRVGVATKVSISGREALIYDGGTKPEKALYVGSRWVLTEAPETEGEAKTELENKAIEKHNSEVQRSNEEGDPSTGSTESVPSPPASASTPQLVCVARGYSVGEVRPSRCLIQRPNASDSESLDLTGLHWSEWGSAQAVATGEELGEHPGQIGSKPVPVRIVASQVGPNPTTGATMFTRVTEYSAAHPSGYTVQPY
jgi:hypothetical protein